MINKKISVAMTTFNGERYVIKQLESILYQTKKPDEVVICDDGSNDSTVEKVINFIESHQLANWHFYQNNPNLGWQKNFFKAANKTTGDIVFFSDQDDIWKDEKIEMMVKMMCEKQMGCLYSEKYIIDGEDKFIEGRQDKNHYTGDVKKVALSNSFFDLKTLGCCMCVDRPLLDLYLKLDFPEGGHDSQCGRLAVLMSTLWHIDLPLIEYRIHGNNTSGISGKASFGQSSIVKRISDIDTTMRWMEKLLTDLNLDKRKKQLIDGCHRFQAKRLRYFNNETSILSLFFDMKYYRNFSMFCGDLAYKHDLNNLLGTLRWRIERILK